NTNITDAGLAHLAGLTNLNWLGLENTNITDAGLAHLYGLTQLKSLSLPSKALQGAAVSALEKALPNCKIDK
ncbi:MAG: hypothetical protein Q4D38_07195, partial [Planctomycetia bacterium]|nr:hypothetical protein [Planctomycetia bacterium]